jgi:ribosomal protein S18 acetylase RimI-like enzyme
MFSVCSAPDLVQALHVQFRELDDNSRSEHVNDLLESARRSRVELSCFVALCESETFIAVQSFVLQKDGTAHVYPVVFDEAQLASPELEEQDRREIANALFSAIDTCFVESDAWIVQSLLRAEQQQACQELSTHGYPHLTDLMFLELDLDEREPSQRGTLEDYGLDRVEYAPDLNGRFASFLEASYVDSADCPELNGRRTGAQALESHRLSGEFSPSMWQLFTHENRDVGVLLLSEHGSGVCEIVYLALIPSVRRCGWGRAILDWGLQQAKTNGNESVMLGVDVRNRAGLQLYENAGFHQFDHRIVHARFR